MNTGQTFTVTLEPDVRSAVTLSLYQGSSTLAMLRTKISLVPRLSPLRRESLGTRLD